MLTGDSFHDAEKVHSTKPSRCTQQQAQVHETRAWIQPVIDGLQLWKMGDEGPAWGALAKH